MDLAQLAMHFVERLNGIREQYKHPPLAVDVGLGTSAQAAAESMASRGELDRNHEHQWVTETDRPFVEELVNLCGPAHTCTRGFIGVGVSRGDNGRYYWCVLVG